VVEDEFAHAASIVEIANAATFAVVVEQKVRLGVSSCLLGEAVRYDGGHKRDPIVRSVLGRFAEWVPVCPELEAGLGVPRPPMRLVRDERGVRLVEVASGRDHTRALARYTAARVRALRSLDLCGYVLKKDSPSCGIARVPLSARGRTRRAGVGVFARGLREAFPDLPVIDESQLRDSALREHFIERAFAYAGVRALFRGRWKVADLAAFHAAHEQELRARAPVRCRALARLVANAAGAPRAQLRDRYTAGFMAALARIRRGTRVTPAAPDARMAGSTRSSRPTSTAAFRRST
jgi:uncharacterized protein YbbK (DUF523 family)